MKPIIHSLFYITLYFSFDAQHEHNLNIKPEKLNL